MIKRIYQEENKEMMKFSIETYVRYLKNTTRGKKAYEYYIKLDIENPISRINTAFKGCSSLEKISVLPRIYHN